MPVKPFGPWLADYRHTYLRLLTVEFAFKDKIRQFSDHLAT
jgi:hypothetical protein